LRLIVVSLPGISDGLQLRRGPSNGHGTFPNDGGMKARSRLRLPSFKSISRPQHVHFWFHPEGYQPLITVFLNT
jgi:hypothetical protein